MANRYWVGGTATWDGTAGTKWATTSGGAGGAAVPTAADDVFFDANSGTGTITTSGSTTDNCRSLDCTGFTGTLNHFSNTDINIGTTTPGPGNVALKLVPGMTYSGASILSKFNFVSTSSTQQTVDFDTKTHAGIVVNGAGSSYLLVSASTIAGGGAFTLTAGTFDTNGQTCSWASITSSNSNVRTLSLGASSITLTSTSVPIQFTTSTNLTFNAGTSLLTCTGNAIIPQFGGQAFYDLAFTGSSSVTIPGSFSCRNFTRTSTTSKTDSLILGADFTCSNTFTATGNSATNRIYVNSNVIGTPRTITAAASSLTNADFMDTTAAGAGVPFSGTSVGDCGGNSGITFTTSTTQTRSGANGTWSGAGNWTSRVPLPQDDVIVNASATGTITGDMPRAGRNVTFTGFAGTYSPNATTAYFGNVTYASGMTLGGNDIINYSGRGTHTITSNGKTIPGAIGIIAPGGSYTLQDNFATSSSLTLTNGTFDANNFNVTASSFVSNNSNTRALAMGSGAWTLTATSGTPWNVTAGTSVTGLATIILSVASASTRTFAGGGFTYGALTYIVAGSTGQLTITGANTFGTINFSDSTNARTLVLPASTTTTITNVFNVNGTAGKLMTVNSSSSGTTATLSKSSGVVGCNYLSLRDSTATGGATWYAGANSVNVSNNTGWIFSNAPVMQTSNFLPFFNS